MHRHRCAFLLHAVNLWRGRYSASDGKGGKGESEEAAQLWEEILGPPSRHTAGEESERQGGNVTTAVTKTDGGRLDVCSRDI